MLIHLTVILRYNVDGLLSLDLLVDLRKHKLQLLKQSHFAVDLSSCLDPFKEIELGHHLLSIDDLLHQLMSVDALLVVLVRVKNQNIEFLLGNWELKDRQYLS